VPITIDSFVCIIPEADEGANGHKPLIFSERFFRAACPSPRKEILTTARVYSIGDPLMIVQTDVQSELLKHSTIQTDYST